MYPLRSRAVVIAASMVLASLGHGTVASASPVVVEDAASSYSLAGHLDYLVDDEAALTIEDVLAPAVASRFSASKDGKLNEGFTPAAVWMRFDVRDAGGQAGDWVLALPYPLLDRIELHTIGPDGVRGLTVFGDALPFTARPREARAFLLPLTLPADGAAQFVVRVTTESSMLLEPVIYNSTHYYETHQLSEVSHGLLFGGLMVMALYNAFLYFAVRDPSYLAYVASVLSGLLYSMSLAGYTQAYLFPDNPQLANLICPLMASAWVMFSSVFAKVFLDTSRFAPRATPVLYLLVGIGAFATLASLFASYRFSMQLASALALVNSIVAMVIGAVCWANGNRYARFFTIGWLVFGGGTALVALSRFGYAPDNFITLNGGLLGMASEAVFLSIALSEKFRTVIGEAYETARNIDQKVDERTLHLSAANAELERASNRDALTNIANRRRFDTFLDDEWTRHRRSGEPIALLMCDVDFFKRYNDRYGHQTGDDCLRLVASAMTAVVHRPSDLVARYGGEEFAVVLPDTDLDGAKQVAREILSAVAALGVEHEDSDASNVVSMSLGAASFVPQPEQAVKDLLRAADAALYSAKDLGRNQVAASHPQRRDLANVTCGTWSGTSVGGLDDLELATAIGEA